MSYLADQLKEKGNAAFRNGEYIEAEACYTQAIQKYSKNQLIFTNRANVRLKLQQWEGAVNDCLKSIEITGPNGQNHKAFYFLGKYRLTARLLHTVNAAKSAEKDFFRDISLPPGMLSISMSLFQLLLNPC